MVDFLEGNYIKPNLSSASLLGSDVKADKSNSRDISTSSKINEIPQDRFIYVQAPPQKGKKGLFGGFLNGAFTTMLIFSITVAFIFAVRGAKELVKEWGWFKPKFKEDNPVILEAKRFFRKFDREKFDLGEGIYDYKWQKLNKVPKDGNYIRISNFLKDEVTKRRITVDKNLNTSYFPLENERYAYKTITVMENDNPKVSVDRIIRDDEVSYALY